MNNSNDVQPNVNNPSTTNQELSNDDSNIESLTVDYDNLYKLESNDKEKEKIKITDQDIQFDNEDYIQDEDIIRKKDVKDTKRNLLFMGIVMVILILVIVFIFPYIFNIGFK
jgi:ATP-dependent Zn protease